MIKKSLKSAISISIGITIGGVIIPRLFTFKDLYNHTYPPIFVHIIKYLATTYIVCFIILLLIGWIKSKVLNNI